MNGGASPASHPAAEPLYLFRFSIKLSTSSIEGFSSLRRTLSYPLQTLSSRAYVMLRRTFQVCGKRFQVLCTLRKSLPDRHAAPNSHRTSFLGREDRLELVWGDDFELGEGAVAGLLVGAPAAELGRVTKTIALHVIVGNLDH